jgi:hypothetical protein
MRGNGWGKHHGSHQDLLRPAGDPAPGAPGLDAIIVPTARHPGQLTEAARLAGILGCTLVTLHSGDRTEAAWAWYLLPGDVDLIAIDVPAPARLNLPHCQTSRLLNGTVYARRTDLSVKRNLGLMLSHMMGWSRVLFLDDDITALNPDDIRRASSLLQTHHAVGLHVAGFPDNSVVCHAYRRVGGNQMSFIGGGALAVDVARCTSFFPDIYNDDWFFMLDTEGWLQPVTRAGRVCQDSFDPFQYADRARAEELGDVLAEGAYWLLDQRQSVFSADRQHWAAFLAKRKQFVERVLDMTERRDFDGNEKQRMVAALAESLHQLTRITPDLCDSYLQAWRDDREVWLRFLSSLPTGQTAEQAVGLLSAPDTRLTWRSRRGREGHREQRPLNPALRSAGGCPAAPLS